MLRRCISAAVLTVGHHAIHPLRARQRRRCTRGLKHRTGLEANGVATASLFNENQAAGRTARSCRQCPGTGARRVDRALNFLAVGQENILIQVAASRGLQLAAPAKVEREIIGMCKDPRFSRTAVSGTWDKLKSAHRVIVPDDEVVEDAFTAAERFLSLYILPPTAGTP